MKIFRWLLGRLVLLINWLTFPKKGLREPALQTVVEQQLQNHSLYQFETCPFCVKVRRCMQELDLPLELRDARTPGKYRDELKNEGGRLMAPCLRIDHEDGTSQWMYESKDIIAYLTEKFPLETDLATTS